MNVVITAIFPTLSEARNASECLAVRPSQPQQMQISLEHCDHEATTAAGRMLHTAQLVDSLPTSAAAGTRGRSAILRIRCTGQLADFVTRELAALGAEKISLTHLN